MRRLVIIVEGETEKEFADKILSNYFYQKGIQNISCYKISKTNGGMTNYLHLKRDLQKAISEEHVLVTTLIDYYALPANFPKYEESKLIGDKNERLSFLEKAILEDIQGNAYLPYLIPYIQLHEFEAFTFTNIQGFKDFFSPKEANFRELEKIINQFENPEDINDHIKTAPSKRLLKLIPSYDKVTDGNNIIRSNGIERIIEKCPRFKNWTEIITQKMIAETL